MSLNETLMKKPQILLCIILLLLPLITWGQALRIAQLENTPDHILGGMLLETIYKKANIPLELVMIPSARALIQSSSGKVDGELERIFKLADSYPTLLRVPTPFTYFEPAAFATDSKIKIQGWHALQDYKVAMVRGMKFAELGLKGFKQVQQVTGSDQLFNMLSAGRADIIVSARFNGLYQISKFNLYKVKQLNPVLDRHDLFHYLHIKHKNLVPVIDSAIVSMTKNGQLAKLRKQYYKDILR